MSIAEKEIFIGRDITKLPGWTSQCIRWTKNVMYNEVKDSYIGYSDAPLFSNIFTYGLP